MPRKKKIPVEVPKVLNHIVVQSYPRAQLIKMPSNGKRIDQGIVLAEGNLEAIKAAANLLAQNDWRLIDCITPSGMIDCHCEYGSICNGKIICSFCGKR